MCVFFLCVRERPVLLSAVDSRAQVQRLRVCVVVVLKSIC